MPATARRTEFVRHPYPHEFVNQARSRNHHHPHSVAVLVPTMSGMILCAESVDATARAEYGLVPPQARFQDRVCSERSLLQHAQTLLRDALNEPTVIRRLEYLGSSWGTKRNGAGAWQRIKCVHWYGGIVPGSARNKLCRDAMIPSYQNPRFVHLKELRGMWGGDAMSADKWRMLRQSYVALAQLTGTPLPFVGMWHHELAADELLPVLSS